MSRRRWLAAAGATLCATGFGCDSDPPQPAQSTAPVVAWLAARQAEDGGWRSANYAPLRTGAALTPLVILATKETLHADPQQRAIAFLRKSVNDDGIVGANDRELLEYPNYATALALECFADFGNETDMTLVERMTRYLVGQQYCEATGFEPEHVCYGGWGFGGSRPVGDSPGHMDIGHTRHVLEGLRAAGHQDPATYARAEKFLHRLQKRDTPGFDGGFYFSPVVLAANKGGEETIDGKSYFRSYATATCDGILSLLSCGAKPDDQRVAAAVEWLKKHPRLDYPEGVLDGTDTNWATSIRFYHFAARAECYAALDWPGDWRRVLREILAKLQRPDGSFVNREGFLMKEDDPILCTALAVLALAKCDD
jgi:hypothetical protein